jgi:uncharacterized short protein YbdD (DUF466 family)
MTAAIRRTLVRWATGARWYVREVTGESGYARYVERERRRCPDAVPMDRRTFERHRQDLVGSRPQQRCC